MITDIFASVTEAVTGMFGAIGSGITEATKLVYDSTQGQLTVFGTFCLIAVGASVCYFGLRLVRSLIHLRG